MENTEIIMNDEVVETATEEIVTSAIPKRWTISSVALVAACVVAYPAYKYVAKPLYRKIKEKKQRSEQPITVVSSDEEDLVEVND